MNADISQSSLFSIYCVSESVGETSLWIAKIKRHSSHSALVSFYTLFCISYRHNWNAEQMMRIHEVTSVVWSAVLMRISSRRHGDVSSSRHGDGPSRASPSSLTNVQTTVQTLLPEQVVWTLGRRDGRPLLHRSSQRSYVMLQVSASLKQAEYGGETHRWWCALMGNFLFPVERDDAFPAVSCFTVKYPKTLLHFKESTWI